MHNLYFFTQSIMYKKYWGWFIKFERLRILEAHFNSTSFSSVSTSLWRFADINSMSNIEDLTDLEMIDLDSQVLFSSERILLNPYDYIESE